MFQKGDRILSRDGKWYEQHEKPGLFKEYEKRVLEIQDRYQKEDTLLVDGWSEAPNED